MCKIEHPTTTETTNTTHNVSAIIKIFPVLEVWITIFNSAGLAYVKKFTPKENLGANIKFMGLCF